MRVVIPQDGPARLDAPADFKNFSVMVASNFRDALSNLSCRGILKPAGDQHFWINPETVRALSPMAGQVDWDRSFEAMVAYANKNGWLSPEGEIRAHVEYADAPTQITADLFRQAMRQYASGVCIVAIGTGEERRGMTISAFSSVSAEPPLILVCINRNSASQELIASSETFSVNILSSTQQDIALAFAGGTGLVGKKKFSVGSWMTTDEGVPRLVGSLQSIVCAPVSVQTAGSHAILVGRVVSANVPTNGQPLVNFDGKLHSTMVDELSVA